MDKKTDLVFEYFDKKYGFDIQKLELINIKLNISLNQIINILTEKIV